MAIYQELLDFKDIFSELKNPPIIINDVMDRSEEEKNELKELIFTHYESDTMTTVPTCDCGLIKGTYNAQGAHGTGVICSNCNTECKSLSDQELTSTLWMRAPHGVEDLINPTAWCLLNDFFKISNFEYIRWYADSSYKPPPNKIPKDIEGPALINIPRGYNSFVKNFDTIINALFNVKALRKAKNVHEDMICFIAENRHKFFSKYLPLPNKSILIVESTPSVNSPRYVDPLVVGAVNAIQIIASIDSNQTAAFNDINNEAVRKSLNGLTDTEATVVQVKTVDDLSTRSKENRTIKAIITLSDFFQEYTSNALAKKNGLLRRQVYGTRLHFSFRAVISSMTGNHSYEDIHIPWSLAVSLFQYHIFNKLVKRGYSAVECFLKFNSSVQKYDLEIDNIFKELIAESKYRGIPVVLVRNPSLERGSMQLLYITKVKTDISDITIALSILDVNGLNADSRFSNH